MTPDDKLDLLLVKLDAMNNMMLGMLAAQQRAPTIAAPTPVHVTDADLDGEHGDPVAKFPPKDDGQWDRFAGQPLSRSSSSFCERMAGFWDWQAGKDEVSGDEKKVKNARYKRLDAARARGWAARLKSREDASGGEVGPDEIPF